MARIGFATYHQAPRLTISDQAALQPLARRGIDVVPFDWQDPAGLPPGLDAIVLRSCWNYHLTPDGEFPAWLQRLEAQAVPVWNPPAVARWNLDKSYLRELASQGIDLPRTAWLSAGECTSLERVLQDHDLDEAVVKPIVSATAYRTWRTSLAEASFHQGAFDELVRERGVMVQAFVKQVVEGGEVSLVFYFGRFSHAVRKRPERGDFRVQADFGGSREEFKPSAGLIAQAEAVLACCEPQLLYARVDGILVGERLVLMELELIDPELYLQDAPAGAERFAAAIAEALATAPGVVGAPSGDPCARRG